MEKFIEVTSKEWGDKRLINTGYIISLVEDEENTAFLVTYRDRKGSKGFSVKESFDELRQKLLGK